MYQKILICGQRCTGKSTLFWNLQKHLNLPTFSVSQYLRDYIRERGLKDHEIAAHEPVMGEEINQRIDNLLLSPHPVIIEARAYYDIKAGHQETLKVLLYAPDHCRINRSSLRERIDREKAAQRLLKQDHHWLEKIADQFGFDDFYDPKYYDLAIDTAPLTPDQVTQKVLENFKLK